MARNVILLYSQEVIQKELISMYEHQKKKKKTNKQTKQNKKQKTKDISYLKPQFFFSRKPNMNHQNSKRSEIEKRKTLGNIMKFQNLKLEKERERQRNLRSKNDNILSREREYLWHGGL